ncbi:uncharacterized protein [Panulirus ornatus]|uniref:uncharacterized protein n=1 Tax=Panulirus ornatus TaxID=150431 RepID=UPI003A8350A2
MAGESSPWSPFASGIPQGPVLFVIYTNDIDVGLKNFVSIFVDVKEIGNIISTDEDRLRLQGDLDEIAEWFRKWKNMNMTSITHEATVQQIVICLIVTADRVPVVTFKQQSHPRGEKQLGHNDELASLQSKQDVVWRLQQDDVQQTEPECFQKTLAAAAAAAASARDISHASRSNEHVDGIMNLNKCKVSHIDSENQKKNDGAESIQVLEFQKDGVASWWTLAEYEGKLDRNWKMDSLTLCARFQIFFLHSRSTFFRLRDREEDLHYQLNGELWLDRVRPAIAHRWQYQLLKNKLRAYRWYHICFTYDHLKHLYNTFIDGELVYELIYNVGRQVYGDYALLGQGIEVYRSFSGNLSQVNVWDYVLNEDTIAEMAACETDPQGNYISWEGGWKLSNLTEYHVPLQYFCQKTTDPIYFWFPKTPQALGFYICEALGTHLPLPTTMDEVHNIYHLSAQAWPNEPVLCKNRFWASITDTQDQGTWVTHYDNAIALTPAWNDGEPNGIFYENCAQIEPVGVADIDCLTSQKCAVCEFSELQIFSLLGTCELELRNVYFIAYQEELGGLIFKGYGEYHIRKEGEEWLWVNVVKNETLARLDVNAPHGMPMGRRVWHLETTVCNQVDGMRTLVLTPCPSDSYTCDDATCIPLENRCDLKYDCLDRSDEVNCELISKPEDYKNGLPPRLSNDKDSLSLPVMLQISIESITVYTTQMTMQLSYEMQMTWFDNRLTFRNLKTNDSLNKVPFTSMMMLWSPIVGFINTERQEHTEVDVETSLYLRRLQPPSGRDNGAPGEVELFPGEQNPLAISRKYSTTFVCDFNLVLYPFDEQHCDMYLRMLSASKSYLMFDDVTTSAAYYGSELLLEYQLQQPKLLYDNSQEFNEMRVRIPLTRRAGYAILNIYTPSLILLVISYVSLFFRPHIFEVRVMTTLTSLLVMATLFTQVSASLPKTSYFKMVDVWLLFCIVMSFLIIISHVFIDNSLEDAKSGVAASSTPALTKVLPLYPGSSTPSISHTGYASINNTTKRLINISRFCFIVLVILFNLIYWSYIFG